jgi:hypothetical protein
LTPLEQELDELFTRFDQTMKEIKEKESREKVKKAVKEFLERHQI